MKKRKIIDIDQEKCNGCGLCIGKCPEGAIQLINGKARLVSDTYCDGLGACIGDCPVGAIHIVEREARPYDERSVMVKIIESGDETIKAHLNHLKEHGEFRYLKEALKVLREEGLNDSFTDEMEKICAKADRHTGAPRGCPGQRIMAFNNGNGEADNEKRLPGSQKSRLRQWPVQLVLVPPSAPYLEGADLLIAADCVPFAYANFHEELLKGRILLIGCPKLDDVDYYKEKLADIFKNNDIKSVTCAHMEVPCCFGIVKAIKDAISDSGKKIAFNDVTISIKGELKR